MIIHGLPFWRATGPLFNRHSASIDQVRFSTYLRWPIQLLNLAEHCHTTLDVERGATPLSQRLNTPLIFREGALHTLSLCQRCLSRTGSPVQRHGRFGPVGTIFGGNSPIGMTVEQSLSLQDRHLIQRSPAVQQSPFLEAAIVPARLLTRNLPWINGGETPLSDPVVVRYAIRRLSRCPHRTLCMSSLRYPMRKANKNFCGSSCRTLVFLPRLRYW